MDPGACRARTGHRLELTGLIFFVNLIFLLGYGEKEVNEIRYICLCVYWHYVQKFRIISDHQKPEACRVFESRFEEKNTRANLHGEFSS